MAGIKNPTPRNYREVQPELLHFLWLGAPEGVYTIVELAAEMDTTAHVVRRALTHLSAEGLVSRVKGGCRNLKHEELGSLYSGEDYKARRRFQQVAESNPTPEALPDHWFITEKGTERVTAS